MMNAEDGLIAAFDRMSNAVRTPGVESYYEALRRLREQDVRQLMREA